MKKTLLLITAAFLCSVGLYAEQEWVFGIDSINFPLSSGIAAGSSVTINGLTITAGTVPTNMGAVDASIKTFGTINYRRRFKFNGGGYTGSATADVTPSVNMPTQRYVSFSVDGNSAITVHGVTGSSSEARRLFLTDGTNLIGTAVMPSGTAITETTLNYSGSAATLYLFCNSSINLYYLKVASAAPASVKNIFADQGVYFNSACILNNRGLELEVYNILGKKVVSSFTSVPTGNLQKGIYFVRVAGVDEIMKFSK